jgi:glyoxylase-like metal-dependent hydrolase (beta-lactamase superfamily II)
MLTRLLTAATALVALCGAARAEPCLPPTPVPDFEHAVIRTTDLGHRTFLLEGTSGTVGGNVAVIVGDDGIIVVDDMYGQMYGKLRAAIAAITPLPVRYVVDTHFHRDHTGGNEAFARDGAVVVAHENVKRVLASGSRSGLTCTPVPPAAESALPMQTYQDTMALRLAGRSAELRHYADTHTSGDTAVWLADANILITGDLAFFGRYPNIDFLFGGSIDGAIRGADELLRLVGPDTTIVPGHGAAGTTATLREYRAMLAAARERVAALKAAGKTEDEVIAARPTADYDAKLKASERGIGNFLRGIYRSLPPG